MVLAPEYEEGDTFDAQPSGVWRPLEVLNWLFPLPYKERYLWRMDDAARGMHTESGLLQACALKGASTEEHLGSLYNFKRAFLALVERRGGKGAPLFGSSPHFDRAFLSAHCGDVLDAAGHRNVDVSSLNYLREAAALPPVFVKRGHHMAENDLRDSLDTWNNHIRAMRGFQR